MATSLRKPRLAALCSRLGLGRSSLSVFSLISDGRCRRCSPTVIASRYRRRRIVNLETMTACPLIGNIWYVSSSIRKGLWTGSKCSREERLGGPDVPGTDSVSSCYWEGQGHCRTGHAVRLLETALGAHMRGSAWASTATSRSRDGSISGWLR